MTKPTGRTRSSTALDTAINRRRIQLGLPWKELAARAGVTQQTLLQLRRGERVAELTEGGVEDALQWQRGSIQKIRDGLAATSGSGDSPSTPPGGALPVRHYSEPQVPVALRDVEDWVEGISWWPSRRDPEGIIVYRLRWLGGPDRRARKEFITEAPPETPLSVMVEYLNTKRAEDLKDSDSL